MQIWVRRKMREDIVLSLIHSVISDIAISERTLKKIFMIGLWMLAELVVS